MATKATAEAGRGARLTRQSAGRGSKREEESFVLSKRSSAATGQGNYATALMLFFFWITALLLGWSLGLQRKPRLGKVSSVGYSFIAVAYGTRVQKANDLAPCR